MLKRPVMLRFCRCKMSCQTTASATLKRKRPSFQRVYRNHLSVPSIGPTLSQPSFSILSLGCYIAKYKLKARNLRLILPLATLQQASTSSNRKIIVVWSATGLCQVQKYFSKLLSLCWDTLSKFWIRARNTSYRSWPVILSFIYRLKPFIVSKLTRFFMQFF